MRARNYAHELTLLRFPLARLYADTRRFPSAMQGRIVILPATAPATASNDLEVQREPDSQSPIVNDGTQIRWSPPATQIAHALLDPTDDAATLVPSPPVTPSAWRPVSPAIGPLPQLHEGPGKQPSALALEFMVWVQQGVADGSLRYNESGALLHFVADGLFLVSPGIFRAYAEAHPVASKAEPGSARDWPGKAVQKAVCSAGWNRKGQRNKSVLTYEVVGREGKPGKTLNGVVVLQPERFFAPVPSANPHLLPAPTEGGSAPDDLSARQSVPSRLGTPCRARCTRGGEWGDRVAGGPDVDPRRGSRRSCAPLCARAAP